MLKFGKIPPRSMESFGVAGLLGEKCTVFYESLFSTKHIGRVSDLLAARLSQEGLDELEFRTLLLFAAFEGYRGSGKDLSSPLLVECGLDEEKVAIGVSFNFSESLNLDPRVFGERIRSQKPASELEKLILEIDAHSDRLVVRVQIEGKRVEIVSLIGITGKIDSEDIKNRQPPEVLVFEKPPQEQVISGEYVQLGDLNYAQLLKDDAPGSKLDAPASGDVIALQMLDQINVGDEVVQVRGAQAEAENVKKVGGGRADLDLGGMRVEGGVPDTIDGATTVGGGSAEADAIQKVQGAVPVSDAFNQVLSGGEGIDSTKHILSGGGDPFGSAGPEIQKVNGRAESISDKLFKVAGADGKISQEAVMQAIAAVQVPQIPESAKLKHYRKQIEELQQKLAQAQKAQQTGFFAAGKGGMGGAFKKLFGRKGAEQEEQGEEEGEGIASGSSSASKKGLAKKKPKPKLFAGPVASETAGGEETSGDSTDDAEEAGEDSQGAEDSYQEISIEVVDANGEKKTVKKKVPKKNLKKGKKEGLSSDALSDKLDQFLQAGDEDSNSEVEEVDAEEDAGEEEIGTLDLEIELASADGKSKPKAKKIPPKKTGKAKRADFSVEMGKSLDDDSGEDETDESSEGEAETGGDASSSIEKLLAAATAEEGAKSSKKKKKKKTSAGGLFKKVWPFKKAAAKAEAEAEAEDDSEDDSEDDEQEEAQSEQVEEGSAIETAAARAKPKTRKVKKKVQRKVVDTVTGKETVVEEEVEVDEIIFAADDDEANDDTTLVKAAAAEAESSKDELWVKKDQEADAVAGKLMEEVSAGGMSRTLDKAQREVLDIRRELQGNPRAQQWVDGLMSDLISEKSKLHEVSKKLSLVFRQKALEFKNREANLREEIRRKDDQVRLKNNALARTKEQLSTTSANLDRIKGSGINAADEAALRHRYQLSQKTLSLAKEENARMTLKIQDMRNQLATAQMGAKSHGPSFTEHQALKTKADRLTFQCEELKKANLQLQDQSDQLQKNTGSAGGAGGGGSEDWKYKYETLNKSASFHQKENEQIKKRYDEMKREEVKLKMEVGRLQNELKSAKASSARAANGFTSASQKPPGSKAA